MNEIEFLQLLPEDVWLIIISYLPRITRQNFAKLSVFQDLIESERNKYI